MIRWNALRVHLAWLCVVLAAVVVTSLTMQRRGGHVGPLSRPDLSETQIQDLRNKAINGSTPEKLEAVVRLSSQRDDWLRAHLDAVSAASAPEVRLAIIRSLHTLCPASRWRILEAALLSRQPFLVAAAAQEAGMMPGASTVALLERVSAGNALPPNDSHFISRVLEDLRRKQGSDPCSAN